MSITNARDWQEADRNHRTSLWVTGVTMALLALGFTRSRASHPAGSNPSSDKREGRVIALPFSAVGVGRHCIHCKFPLAVGRTSFSASGKTSARIASLSLPRG